MTLIPAGGLANRMRAVAGAVTFMRELGGNLRIFWFRDWALNAPFGSLFCPIDLPNVSLAEGGLMNSVLYDRPRRRNLWIPSIYQRLAFDFRLYEKVVWLFRDNPSDMKRLADASNSYVASYHALVPYTNDVLRRLFRPVASIQQEIDRRCGEFSAYTVGCHIRRTDNIESIRQSPLELFYNVLDAELASHADLRIYLATDSEDVKAQMRERYGDRILTASAAADRDSIEGIADGIADMYTLARTNKIYGSSGSSFSELAAQLGDTPLTICALPKE